MNKKLIIIIFTFLTLGLLIFFIAMDVVTKEGIFSSYWWWLIELILLVVCAIIWLVVWLLKRKKEEIKIEKPKEEIKKGDIFEFEEILDNYWKDKRNKDPDMYKIDEMISFPSEEDPRIKIIRTKEGYNLNKRLLLAIDTRTKKIVDKSEEDNLEKFKEHLKPRLEEVRERIETEPLTGRETRYKYTRPVEEIIKEEEEKEKEEEKIETMTQTKKEEK